MLSVPSVNYNYIDRQNNSIYKKLLPRQKSVEEKTWTSWPVINLVWGNVYYTLQCSYINLPWINIIHYSAVTLTSLGSIFSDRLPFLTVCNILSHPINQNTILFVWLQSNLSNIKRWHSAKPSLAKIKFSKHCICIDDNDTCLMLVLNLDEKSSTSHSI